MAKLITLANQKGGSGKSTATSFFANALHDKGYKVKIIDSDFQRSIYNIRKADEAELLEENIPVDNLYPILYIPVARLINSIEDELEGYDFVFVDLPGNLTEKNIIDILLIVDAIIVVHDPNTVGASSTLDFYNELNKHVITPLKEHNEELPTILNLASRIDTRKKKHSMFLNEKEELYEFPWFSKYLRALTVFEDLQTVKPYKNSTYDYEFEMIINEFLNTLK